MLGAKLDLSPEVVYLHRGTRSGMNALGLGIGRLFVEVNELPRELRSYCDGASELMLSATSVRALLEELERRHPSLYRGICDETGAVRRHANLFVNTDLVEVL